MKEIRKKRAVATEFQAMMEGNKIGGIHDENSRPECALSQ